MATEPESNARNRTPQDDWDDRLNRGVDSLFRPVAANGFWDDADGKIIRALEYSFTDGELVWTPDDTFQWRYSPFALMGVFHWRTADCGDDRHDPKIRSHLEYLLEQLPDEGLQDVPSYGLGPLLVSLVRADEVFSDTDYLEPATRIGLESKPPRTFDHNEDALLLLGWAELYRRSGADEVRSRVRAGLDHFKSQFGTDLYTYDSSSRGFQQYSNLQKTVYDLLYGGTPSRRHQNQMYTLWGVGEAAKVLDDRGVLTQMEQVLEYTVWRRMREDGGIIWEDVSSFSSVRGDVLSRLGLRPPHWYFLYTCHQSFFAHAVAVFESLSDRRRFADDAITALEWIFENDVSPPLSRGTSNLGVPMRFVTIHGDFSVDDQMYKGTYEIGAYLMALTDLVDGTFDS